jgi:hypothetical protein
LQLLELMARTPASSWPGCPAFGVRDYFERMRFQPQGLNQAAKAINTALQDLGITRYKLASIVVEPAPNSDTDNYVLTLADTSEAGRTYSTSVGRK